MAPSELDVNVSALQAAVEQARLLGMDVSTAEAKCSAVKKAMEKQQSEAAADEAAEAARRLEHHNARKVLFDSAGGVKAAIAGLVCSQDTKQPDDPPPETPL